MVLKDITNRTETLKEFGFTPRYDTYTGEIEKYIMYTNKDIIRHIKNDHNHNDYWEVKLDEQYLLFEMIKYNLIERW